MRLEPDLIVRHRLVSARSGSAGGRREDRSVRAANLVPWRGDRPAARACRRWRVRLRARRVRAAPGCAGLERTSRAVGAGPAHPPPARSKPPLAGRAAYSPSAGNRTKALPPGWRAQMWAAAERLCPRLRVCGRDSGRQGLAAARAPSGWAPHSGRRPAPATLPPGLRVRAAVRAALAGTGLGRDGKRRRQGGRSGRRSRRLRSDGAGRWRPLRVRCRRGCRRRPCAIAGESRSEGRRRPSRRVGALRDLRLNRLRARQQHGEQPGAIARAFAVRRASGGSCRAAEPGRRAVRRSWRQQTSKWRASRSVSCKANAVGAVWRRLTRRWPAIPAVATAFVR
jgi:hypothetical protein